MYLMIFDDNLAKAILMSTHNIGFYEDLTKFIFELSSNTHIISSADLNPIFGSLFIAYLQCIGFDLMKIIL